MSAEVLKGIEVAKAINESISERVKNLDGYIPRLAIVRVGEKADDIAYEKGAVKKMEKLGLEYTLYTYPEDITNERFQNEFDRINRDNEIDGILLLRPLPKHIDEEAIAGRIDPYKDLDSMFPIKKDLVLNTDHPLVLRLHGMASVADDKEKLDALCLHLYDQARLAHGSLDAEGLKRFLKYNSELLTEVAEKLK